MRTCREARVIRPENALFVRCSQQARARGLFLLQYNCNAGSDLRYRRLPLPWVSFVVRLSDPGHWRSPGGEWRPVPRVALRGAATSWIEGRDAATTRAEYVVALLEPWAISGIFGIPAAELHNQIVDVEHLCRAWARTLYDKLSSAPDTPAKLALMEQAVMRGMSGREPDPLVKASVNICRQSAGDVRLRSLTESLDCSRLKLRTSFKQELGVMPKRWALLERFAARARELHPRPWGGRKEVIGPAYTDQAHEIHEFVRHTGVTPGLYRRLKREGDPRIFIIPSSP